MISNVLTRVPSAGKFQPAAEVAASTHAFRHCYTGKPSPTFRFTVFPIIQTRSTQNCIIAWSCRTEDGIPVLGSSPIRLFQRQDHHASEPYRIELPSSLQKYTRMDVSSFFLVCSLFTLCIYFILSTVKIKKKRLPPGPTGLPVLGSLVTIGNRPHESLSKLAKTYGPLMTVKFGMIKIVVVSSAEMAREIFQKKDQAFSGRPAPEAVVAEKDYDMSMVWSSGQSPHWKKLRKICNSQLFTTQRLDASQELRHMMMQKMIEQVDEARLARQPLHVGTLGFGTTLNFLSNTMFSSDMFETKSDATTELKELIGDLIELVGKPNVADYLPFLKPFDPQGIRRGLTLLYERLRKFLDGVIERRIKHRACGSDRYGDFLDVLLDHTEEDGPLELNYQNISVLLMDLFLGGTHTTTTLLEWTMAELLHNPSILAKAKQELSKEIPPRQIVQEQDISRLPYLVGVTKEALRLHPIAPILVPHQTEQEVEIHGYTIPKHTQVFVNAWSILRDPAYWDDPASFKPDRFLNSDTDFRGKDFKYIPFGAGRRICPGSSLAMRMVSLMLANLVHNFDWELPNGLKPEDLDMNDGLGMTLHKHEPLVVIPVDHVA